ncbi:MlaD family protein [Mycobacterium vicinigordonae]|uniref:MCE family protein n=1 Tax=Mycobacterium vicinigordonae TaxID=1719132 RepID=A0A7D6DZT9_9MYCO|nr:MlaD family protein [Mycobacterium vicinigordonae]QLL08704.1 MCE family protein [Mycobacterium vicinigordonae]
MKIRSTLWRLAISVAVAAVLFVLLANILSNPVAAQTRTYVAEFTDASGLHPDADVRVRGVRVGKVERVKLAQRNGQDVASVHLTLDKKYGVVSITRLAIKYQALTGQRYVDVQNASEGYSPADLVTNVPIAMTKPSFDITSLFNGLQPVLATVSPDELNNFTANAASFLSGDGGSIGPLLDSLHRFTSFVSDRQQVLATLMQNLAGIANGIDGQTKQFMHIVELLNQPVEATLTVLDEFRKSELYGPNFTEPVVRMLHNMGLKPGGDVDAAMDRAFKNLDNFFDAFKLVPVMWDNVPLPDEDPAAAAPCSKGPMQLPETMDILLNGTRVVLCNR